MGDLHRVVGVVVAYGGGPGLGSGSWLVIARRSWSRKKIQLGLNSWDLEFQRSLGVRVGRPEISMCRIIPGGRAGPVLVLMVLSLVIAGNCHC